MKPTTASSAVITSGVPSPSLLSVCDTTTGHNDTVAMGSGKSSASLESAPNIGNGRLDQCRQAHSSRPLPRSALGGAVTRALFTHDLIWGITEYL